MDDPQPTKPRASIEDVIQDLIKRRPSFENFCQETKFHLEKCLRDAEIPFQSIQSRVKDEAKIKNKYSDPSKADRYFSLDDLTDIAGLRVITYYEDDVDKVKELIEQEFAIDLENCEDKRLPDNPETFAYHALHLVVSLKPETLGKRAHKQFSGIRGEIQITSILRHAWAEMNHRWYDLKDSFPPTVKRRFSRLSALIDLADEQFVELREEWEQLKSSIDRGLEGGFMDIPIDTQSLRSFIEQDPLVREVDQEIAIATQRIIGDKAHEEGIARALRPAGLHEQSLNIRIRLFKVAGLHTLGDLRVNLRRYRAATIEYVTKLENRWMMTNVYGDPIWDSGSCLFHLAMMIFLSDFINTHPNETPDQSRREIEAILRSEDIRISPFFLPKRDSKTQPGFAGYEILAKIAQTIMAKYHL